MKLNYKRTIYNQEEYNIAIEIKEHLQITRPLNNCFKVKDANREH